MSEEKKGITIVMLKYSVIVKGIERKLADCSYEVQILAEDYDMIRHTDLRTALFIVYLPKGIAENRGDLGQLSQIYDLIHETGRNVVLIGEKDDGPRLMKECPHLLAHAWVNRPVKMDELEEIVEKAIKDSGKKKILIVDDDPSYAKMAQEWIKDEYQTYCVTAGMQAITFLLKHPVDLILLDYEMPVVDGPQVLQMLRQEPDTQGIPVVFLTGVSTREGVERVMALKPDGYILKSTTKEKLLEYLREKI